jgi:endonuclease/exonuclease/phosphatase family metal-dependent hydrolase
VAELRIVTFNLRGVHDRWWKREPLVVGGLAELRPDVICLQEAATWCLQARWLAWRISRRTGQRYHVRQARKRGWRGIFEGVAILSRYPLGDAEALGIGGEGRVALRAVVRAGGGLLVANTHLEHRAHNAGLRREQLRRIVAWLSASALPQVLAGDLNDVPESEALAELAAGWRTAHVSAETPLFSSPAREPKRLIDYIMVVEGVQVLEAGTCMDRPTDGTFPSDHIGLWARLQF